MISYQSLLLVAAGGATGSILRFLVSAWSSRWWNHSFPLGTFTANIIGCLLIGLLIGWLTSRQDATQLKLLLITGFCGGFTTFSAFSAENVQLMQNGQGFLAVIYIAVSVLTGIFAVWAGTAIISK